MEKVFFAQITAIFLMVLLKAPSATAHDSCTYCHINATPVAGNAGLLSSLPGLCISCHPDRVGNSEHVIDVKPVTSMAMPLPLVDGKLNCTTCHDSHGSSPTLLRAEKTLLCGACHSN